MEIVLRREFESHGSLFFSFSFFSSSPLYDMIHSSTLPLSFLFRCTDSADVRLVDGPEPAPASPSLFPLKPLKTGGEYQINHAKVLKLTPMGMVQ